MITASLVIVMAAFGIYSWLAGVEFGLALLRLLPGSTATRQTLKLFSPAWELSNLFLLIAVGSAATLFGHGFVDLRAAVLPVLTIGMAALLLRVGLLISYYYGGVKPGASWRNLLFAAVSFIVPLSLGAVDIRLLLGQQFWQSLGSWTMFISLGIGILALALAYIYYAVGKTPHGRIQSLSLTINALFCVLVALVLQQVVAHRQPHIVAAAFVGFVMMVAFVVLLQAALWFSARDRYMWWYLSLLAVVSPVLLALANQPYLMYPNIFVENAFSHATHASLRAASYGLVLIIVIAGSGAVAWLLLRPRRR